MPRVLHAELLDTLPPHSAAALRGRRDLLRINRIMGNHAWFLHTVPRLALLGERALELGAGDGSLAMRLHTEGVAVDALDRVPAPASWPRAASWHRTDLHDFGRWRDYPVVLANLFLHHLSDLALAALGAQLDRHARVLVFNEPLRSRRSRLLWALGARLGRADPVTLHDGRVSIGAGFHGDELAHSLRLDPADWEWRTHTTFLGASRFVAVRRS